MLQGHFKRKGCCCWLLLAAGCWLLATAGCCLLLAAAYCWLLAAGCCPPPRPPPPNSFRALIFAKTFLAKMSWDIFPPRQIRRKCWTPLQRLGDKGGDLVGHGRRGRGRPFPPGRRTTALPLLPGQGRSGRESPFLFLLAGQGRGGRESPALLLLSRKAVLGGPAGNLGQAERLSYKTANWARPGRTCGRPGKACRRTLQVATSW